MRSTAVRRSIATVAGFLLLTLSACTVPGFGPDADDAVDQLAKALSSGDVKSVDFAKDDAAARTAYKAITDGMGKAKVSPGDVSTDGDSATGKLDWRWKVGSKTWSYDTEVRLAKGKTDDGDAWLVRWDPALVESSLKPGERLVETAIKPERGAILGADGKAIVTQRPVLRVGIDKSTLKGDEAKRSASSLAQLVDVDAKAYVKQVTAAGPKAFVQAIVYRRNEVPAPVLGGLSGIKGARAISDRLPLAPTKDFANAILGTVGPATAELVKDSDGRIRGRRRRRHLRPAEEVRRAAVRHPRSEGRGRGREGRAAYVVHRRPQARQAIAYDDRAGDPADRTAGAGRRTFGQRTRGDPALDRRPGRCGERARLQRPEHCDLRPLRPGVDLQGGQHPRAPPGGRHPTEQGVLPGDDRGRRQALQELRRLPGLRPRRDHLRGRARQLVQHRVHLPARPARGRTR